MEKEIKKIIHAFRNALVMAADTHSYACFFMPRWSGELNGSSLGCCETASNFLAKYLIEHGYRARIIIFICSTEIIKIINSPVVFTLNDHDIAFIG